MHARVGALAVQQASVSLSGRPILHDIDFSLAPGEFCGLIGANGSGKTTLLRTILGLVKPTSGRILIGGDKGSASVGYVPRLCCTDRCGVG